MDMAAATTVGARGTRSARLVGSAHMVPVTQPDALAARIAAFVDEQVRER
jgi:hypothetical protein